MQINITIQFDPTTETLDNALAALGAGVMPKNIENHGTINFDLTRTKPNLVVNQETVDMVPEEAKAPAEEAPAEIKPTKKKAEKPAPTVSKSDVLALATAMSKAGKKDALKAVFAKFNAVKLSDIAEEDYPALMKELGEANA